MFTIFLTKTYVFIFIPVEFHVFVPIILACHDIFEYTIQYIKYLSASIFCVNVISIHDMSSTSCVWYAGTAQSPIFYHQDTPSH